QPRPHRARTPRIRAARFPTGAQRRSNKEKSIMAQLKKSGINWKLYGGILVVGLIAYFMTSSSPPAATSAAAAKKKPVATAGQTLIQPIDHNVTSASFDLVSGTIKDTFVPIVYHSQLGSGQPPIKIPPSELTIPVNFTGGEANWAFTGVVGVDGKSSALVENGTSGQSAYIHAGERWKTSTVQSISEDTVHGVT